MPGDEWQRFANLRLCFAYQFMYPGKKLMFMGSELAQSAEWSHDASVHWDLLENDANRKMLKLVRELNHLYQSEPSLHQSDCHADGFEWIDCADIDQSVVSFYRHATSSDHTSNIVVCNFTPVPRHDYRLGVNDHGKYVEILNTDAACFGGSDVRNMHLKSDPAQCHGRANSLILTLPPLSVIVLRLDT